MPSIDQIINVTIYTICPDINQKPFITNTLFIELPNKILSRHLAAAIPSSQPEMLHTPPTAASPLLRKFLLSIP